MKKQWVPINKKSFISTLSLIFLSLSSQANTALDRAIDEYDVMQWQPVTEKTLATLRGGFVLSNGLIVDLTFQKHLFQNGELTSHTYLQTPQDYAQLSKDGFALSSVLLNNTINTVLQNTLDDQTLSTITNIDITIQNIEQANQAFTQDQLYNTYFNASTHQ
jgi:hypothetical protein